MPIFIKYLILKAISYQFFILLKLHTIYLIPKDISGLDYQNLR
jgi:hypothetical protein